MPLYEEEILPVWDLCIAQNAREKSYLAEAYRMQIKINWSENIVLHRRHSVGSWPFLYLPQQIGVEKSSYKMRLGRREGQSETCCDASARGGE